ncbi:MAG: DUF3422 domain-containing protein [Alcaligenaceae bacterium]|nr:DUF3422 domain-containing protein [Alcaligenaceae bacterium]
MHQQRETLHNELHSRPSTYFDAPAHIFHLAFLDEDGTAGEMIRGLCDAHQPTLDPDPPQGQITLGASRLKWERHTEFLTLTLVVPGRASQHWPELPPILADIAKTHDSILINAEQICVESEKSWTGCIQDYGFTDPVGSDLDGGKASVFSDLRLNDGGINRILTINYKLDGRRLGRMVRRLLEIETYRMMASLTLPIARSLNMELRQFEAELVRLSDQNAQAAQAHDDKALLAQIAGLSARIMQTATRTRLRFSATEAYAQLVFERLAELRESRSGDCQQLGVFIERRFRPTVRYCASTDRRLARIGNAVAQLGDLLQARVQVEMEEQNALILNSLSTRADTQIKIQKAVEGLSIIAISYYLLSLLKLLYGGMLTLGLDISPRTAILIGLPIAALIIAAIAHRIRDTKRH